jgi:predicted transcriptional regulator
MRSSVKKKARRRKRSRSAVVRAIGHERPTAEERAAIAEGRAAYRRGDFVTLDDWRHAVGLSK